MGFLNTIDSGFAGSGGIAGSDLADAHHRAIVQLNRGFLTGIESQRLTVHRDLTRAGDIELRGGGRTQALLNADLTFGFHQRIKVRNGGCCGHFTAANRQGFLESIQRF